MRRKLFHSRRHPSTKVLRAVRAALRWRCQVAARRRRSGDRVGLAGRTVIQGLALLGLLPAFEVTSDVRHAISDGAREELEVAG